MNWLPSDALPFGRVLAMTFGSLPSVEKVVVSLTTVHVMESLSQEFDLALHIHRATRSLDESHSGFASDSGSKDTTCHCTSIPFPGLLKIQSIHVTFYSSARGGAKALSETYAGDSLSGSNLACKAKSLKEMAEARTRRASTSF
ncbi:hypothetical protein D9619_003505 [Psilocybe cf. subviscida]|uniref:Uncharacterized protein n=1 Tax=Psilocybe cf. subviscida TaxID=2480587 RepID=A0A8H5AWE2_9AGAR|nr:hypothetical protein D9619_003505 [Psilocybe cf. subviscida]